MTVLIIIIVGITGVITGFITCELLTASKRRPSIDKVVISLDTAEWLLENKQTGKINPFCSNCKESNCCVSLDGTCAMIREYLKTKKVSKV